MNFGVTSLVLSLLLLSVSVGIGQSRTHESSLSGYRGKVISQRPRGFPEKLLALTIDDGPSPNITPRILDALKSHHAHATFFVLGANAVRHPELLRRMVAEGHSIGSHTFS